MWNTHFPQDSWDWKAFLEIVQGQGKSSLILSFFKDGDPTISLGNLLTVFFHPNSSKRESFNVYFRLCPLPHVLSLGTTEKCQTSLLTLHQEFKHMDKIPLSFPLSRLNRPTSFGLSLHARCSKLSVALENNSVQLFRATFKMTLFATL